MTIVPWASTNATRTFAASAQPQAPVVDDSPSALVRLWRGVTRHA